MKCCLRFISSKKQDSFEVDDPMPLPKKSDAASRKDVLSPDNSRSISSKFRKPGRLLEKICLSNIQFATVYFDQAKNT